MNASNLRRSSQTTKAGQVKLVESEDRILILAYLGTDQRLFGLHVGR